MMPFNALTVALEPGVTLVEASAGTGKTFAITRLLLRLLLERKVDDLSQILVVTFTEKATQELISRIRGVLREADRVWSSAPPPRTAANDDLFVLRDEHGDAGAPIVRAALAALDDLGVSTIHGFCHRVLSESALESRVHFGGTFLEDDTEILHRLSQDWIRRRVLHDEEAAAIMSADGNDPLSWVRSLVRPYLRHPNTTIDAAPDAAPSLLKDFVLTVTNAFAQEKRARHLMGFDDLLRRLHDIIVREGPGGLLATRIRDRFRVAMIDEFQDTDPTQYPIFSIAFDGCPLFLIGDPKQSIFAFRNADVRAYLKAAEGIARRYTLLTNFRSTDALVRGVSALFRNSSQPFACDPALIGVPHVVAADNVHVPDALRQDIGTGARAALHFMWIGEEFGRAGKPVSKDHGTDLAIDAVVAEMTRLLARGLRASDIAVLVRTNGEAQQVKAALDEHGIPGVVGTSQDVLCSEEADEIVRLCEAIASPRDAVGVRSAMATRLWGSDATSVAETLLDENGDAWNEVLRRLNRARLLWTRHGGATALTWLLNECGATARLLALRGGDRRVTNLRHVLEVLQQADTMLTPDAVLGWIARERESTITPERREVRLESDADAVQVLTIHKAKGLQWPVVFCPTLWRTRKIPSKVLGVPFTVTPEGDGMVLDLGSPRQMERTDVTLAEQLGEDLRLAYVALTRAESRCYVAWGALSDAHQSPLGWLIQQGDPAIGRDAIDRIVLANSDTMSLEPISRAVVRTRSGEVDASPAVRRALVFSTAPGQLATWRSSSFTMLTRNATHVESPSDDRDVDDVLESRDAPRTRRNVPGFRGMPAGADTGNALHALFEITDFSKADALSVENVGEVLERFGVAAPTDARWTARDVADKVRTVCAAGIPNAGLSLRDVPMSATLREWRFSIPVRDFSVTAVADALAEHGSDHAREYAPLLRRLSEDRFRGYLTGSIDLAFEHDSRWHILDWKSNWLGSDNHDYTPSALNTAMHAAHYTLQYHVYLVALHRHLSARQTGYDPTQHWGQVTYAFLRGINATGETGWFTDVPTPALLHALDRAFGRHSGAAR